MEAEKSAPSFSEADRTILAQLSREFRASLIRYFARRVQGLSDVEDMVQEVFLRLARRGDTSALVSGNVNAYIFEAASSVLSDRLRKRRTHCADAHETFDCDRHCDTDFSAEHVLLGKERLTRAIAVLLELPDRTRVIFVLRRLEGMRFADIAARLGISVSAVEKHMQRAIAHLMRRIDQE